MPYSMPSDINKAGSDTENQLLDTQHLSDLANAQLWPTQFDKDL